MGFLVSQPTLFNSLHSKLIIVAESIITVNTEHNVRVMLRPIKADCSRVLPSFSAPTLLTPVDDNDA